MIKEKKVPYIRIPIVFDSTLIVGMRLVTNTGRETLSSLVNSVSNLLSWSSTNPLVSQWLDEGTVNNLGTTKLWKGEVEQEDGLHEPVEWDPVKDGLRPELNNVQEGKDNPVCQEFGVILSGFGVEGLEGQVTWDDETGYVRKQLTNTTNVDEDQKEVQDTSTDNGVGSWKTGSLLELGENVVTSELL